MRRGIVYLAGPITGLSYGEVTDWRAWVREELGNHDIYGACPMRGKEYLSHIQEMAASPGDKYMQMSVLSTNRGIMTRDRFDALRCDVLLVNFLGAQRVSIGTCMEIAWADSRRTPIVCAMEPEGNPHEHAMILEAVGFRVPSLEGAVHIIKSILL
jgi:hypothetical protein